MPVEPTLYVARRSPWQQFWPPHKSCHDFSLAQGGARSGPLHAGATLWYIFRRHENGCHGERLGTKEAANYKEVSSRGSSVSVVLVHFVRWPPTVLYGKNPTGKFRKNPKNGRALRAKRAAHAHSLELSGIVLLDVFPYNTVPNFFSFRTCPFREK